MCPVGSGKGFSPNAAKLDCQLPQKALARLGDQVVHGYAMRREDNAPGCANFQLAFRAGPLGLVQKSQSPADLRRDTTFSPPLDSSGATNCPQPSKRARRMAK